MEPVIPVYLCLIKDAIYMVQKLSLCQRCRNRERKNNSRNNAHKSQNNSITANSIKRVQRQG